MSDFTITRDKSAGATPIPNRFIDEYMVEANDAQIKIYLYLLRLMEIGEGASVSFLADFFNFTEKDVTRALKYWEKKHLLSLDFDSQKNLCGIKILDFPQENVAVSPAPIVHISRENEKSVTSAEAATATGNPNVPAGIAGKNDSKICEPVFEVPEKPTYSVDKLASFAGNKKAKELVFVAETYLGKPLSTKELSTLIYFHEELHFSDDLIDYLLQYCVDRGKKSFNYIEAVALSWASQHISTVKQAQKSTSQYEKAVYSIMNALGKKSSPTEAEVSYIAKWTKDYAFDLEIIYEACKRTVLATDSNRFKYADSILKSWHDSNVIYKSDIASLDEKRKNDTKKSSSKTQSNNKFNSFNQNSYDFEALEKDIVSN